MSCDTPFPLLNQQNTIETVPFMLGRLESKVDMLLQASASYDKRITTVERKQYWMSGAGAVLGAIAAKIVPLGNIMGFH